MSDGWGKSAGESSKRYIGQFVAGKPQNDCYG